MRPLSLGLGLRGPFHHKPQDIGSKENFGVLGAMPIVLGLVVIVSIKSVL